MRMKNEMHEKLFNVHQVNSSTVSGRMLNGHSETERLSSKVLHFYFGRAALVRCSRAKIL